MKGLGCIDEIFISEEIPKWLISPIIKERDRLKEYSENNDNYIDDRIRCEVAWRKLNWVLSLKNPEVNL